MVYSTKGLEEIAIEAFKESCKQSIMSIIADPNPTERQYQWLSKTLLTREDTLARILREINSLNQEEENNECRKETVHYDKY